jgi:hypothetical protein
MSQRTTWHDTDRWVNNVMFRRPLANPRRPRARFVKRRPVSLRAIRVRPISDLRPNPFEDQPIDFDPAWSTARTIEFWQARL